MDNNKKELISYFEELLEVMYEFAGEDEETLEQVLIFKDTLDKYLGEL